MHFLPEADFIGRNRSESITLWEIESAASTYFVPVDDEEARRESENVRLVLVFLQSKALMCWVEVEHRVYIYIYSFFEISSSRVGLGEQVVRPCVCVVCCCRKKKREKDGELSG